uniref:Uncharacterized protein n=1 Tax=viral metagenome TaxID=1070528 RepID=A0A6C0AQG3_9ZZZZ
MIPVFSLRSNEIQTVQPSCGWNPSLSSADRLTWANLFVKAKSLGLSDVAAEKMAFMKMYQIQMPGLRWLP